MHPHRCLSSIFHRAFRKQNQHGRRFAPASRTRRNRWRNSSTLSRINGNGPRIPAETLERLWTMLAHGQGGLLNASGLGRALAISTQTVLRYIDLLVNLLLVRRLQPYHANLGKRLVKTPKVYVRDSGLLHALLNIESLDRLAGHPVIGVSWEGLLLENLLAALSWRTQPLFYRTAVGAEIDLVLERPNGERWAIEIKRGLAAKLERGFYRACEDLSPTKAFVVYSGEERYPVTEGVEAISVRDMALS